MANPDIGVLDLSALPKEKIIEFFGDKIPIRKKSNGNNKCPLYLATKAGSYFANTQEAQDFLLEHATIFGAVEEVENQDEVVVQSVQVGDAEPVEASHNDETTETEPKDVPWWERSII